MQFTITVPVGKLGELRSRFPEFVEEVKQGVRDKIQTSGRDLIQGMLGMYKTGKLASTLQAQVTGKGVELTIGPALSKGHDYAPDVFFGVEKHIIEPKTPGVKALHWKRFGLDIYFKKVEHPGQKARKDIIAALRAMVLRITTQMVQALISTLEMAGVAG